MPKLIDEVNGFVAGAAELRRRPDRTAAGGSASSRRSTTIVEKVRSRWRTAAPRRCSASQARRSRSRRASITLDPRDCDDHLPDVLHAARGPAWVERFYGLFPEHSQPRWRRVGDDIYKTVGGYVTGNLLISLIAGICATIVLLIMGVPYAVALGLLVAILDLIPLAGATVAGIVSSTVAFLHSSRRGSCVLVFVIVYQQLENHFLQPLIYGRTVQLSPLVVLISVLIGAELAGILGALAAIPVAGSIQVRAPRHARPAHASGRRAWRCRPETPHPGRIPRRTNCGSPDRPFGADTVAWPFGIAWAVVPYTPSRAAPRCRAALGRAGTSTRRTARAPCDRARVRRARRVERRPRQHGLRPLTAQRAAFGAAAAALARDGSPRLLRARVADGTAFWKRDQALLRVERLRALVGRREPALVVARRRARGRVELWMH